MSIPEAKRRFTAWLTTSMREYTRRQRNPLTKFHSDADVKDFFVSRTTSRNGNHWVHPWRVTPDYSMDTRGPLFRTFATNSISHPSCSRVYGTNFHKYLVMPTIDSEFPSSPPRAPKIQTNRTNAASNTISMVDPVTMRRVNPRSAYYIKPDVLGHTVRTVYALSTLKKLLELGHGNARSPLTRHPFTISDVYRLVPTASRSTRRSLRFLR